MNKLYTNLHIEILNSGRSLLFTCLLFFFGLLISNSAVAQCVNTTSSGVVTAPSTGNTTQINSCAIAGDYSTINAVVSSTSYSFTSSISTDYFTVRQGTPSGPVVAFGPTPVTWTATAAGTYYLHISATAGCVSNSTCRITSIRNNGTCSPVPVSVTPVTSCGGVIATGPCDPLTATGADTYTWFPIAGLFMDCAHNIPYTGQGAATVYAAPTTNSTYTVTGLVTATGCSSSTTAMVNYTPSAPIITPSPVNMCIGDPAVKIKVVPAIPPIQYCSGPVNIAVPDNNPAGVFNTIAVAGVPAGCVATSVSVTINMTHPKAGDMVFVLKAPNGVILNLDYYLGGTGGSGATTGFTNTVISPTGVVPLSVGTDPYTGIFKADIQNTPIPGFGSTGPTGMIPTATNWTQLFSVLNGAWTLGMYDGVASNSGTLLSWCLNITYSCGTGAVSQAIWSPAAGLCLDPAATIPYIAGTAVDSVYTRPSLAGVYIYQVTVQGPPQISASFTNPAAMTIPVGGPASVYPSTVSVFGLPVSGVMVRSVVLTGINHTAGEDLDIVLQSPSGQNVMLMSDVGGTAAISNVTYTFTDAALANMSVTSANLTGTYKPTNQGSPDNFPAPGPSIVSAFSPPLSLFAGNLNGTWKLFVSDDDGTANQGSITGGVTINFEAGLPGCTSPPGTVVVTVNQSIVITTQPVNQAICAGSTATFTVAVSGTGPYTYQWQQSSNGGATFNNIINAGVYSGATTGTLTITAPPVSMTGYKYRVVVNGAASCGSATSLPATLTVYPLPTVLITANPLILNPGDVTTIHSTVTPNPAATYTWYLYGSVVPGATADTLLVDINGLGEYQLAVTDVNGCTNLSNTIVIDHAFSGKLFVYPNPSSGMFQVRSYSETNSPVQRSLVVYNYSGRRLITRQFTQTIPFQRIDVDARAYGKGIYWVEILDKDGKRLNINRVVVQ